MYEQLIVQISIFDNILIILDKKFNMLNYIETYDYTLMRHRGVERGKVSQNINV